MTLPHIFQAVEHKRLYSGHDSCREAFLASPHEPVDIFLSELPKFGSYGIGLIKGPFLRVNTQCLFEVKASIAYFTDISVIGIARLRQACWSHGHLSAMFVSERPDALLDHYLTLMCYRRKGRVTQLGSGNRADPLGIKQATLLRDLIQSYHLSRYMKLFSFSHDADYFYNISVDPK